ncbi:MAG: glycosyltransferase [Candidatus Omnitrophota bacterium]
MRGDKLLIKKIHTKTAWKISKILIPEIFSSSSKYVISIAGESGTGKTEIACELAKCLKIRSIKSVLINQDDYFFHPPKTNYKLRRENLSRVGPPEINLPLLNRHIKTFKDIAASSFRKPLIFFKNDKIEKETVKCENYKVMIIEGTYVNLLNNVDSKIFLSGTYRDTLQTRKKRKRDKIDEYGEKILSIEHGIISKQNKLSDIVVKKDYLLNVKHTKKPDKKIKRICMLSVHGYVDVHPTLGKTDTGGQVVYVLELSKALAKNGIKVDIFTRQFLGRKHIEHVNKNVRIVRIPCGGKNFIPKEKIFPHLNTFVKNMALFMRKEGLCYNVIHSHYWDAGYVAMKLSDKLNYFFVHTFHSLGAWKKTQMGGNPAVIEKLYNFKQRIKIEKQIYEKARSLVMTSSDMIGRSTEFYGYKKKNYILLPAGVNTSVFRPLKKGEKERNIDVPQNYIFWVGRFDTNKGLEDLLLAFSDIVRKAKDLFLIIGGGSARPELKEKKLRKRLQQIIKVKQIKNRVFFTRYIPDLLMPTYYRRAKFFILPSQFEPFGMTAAEAMACGTALIVSKRAGITRYLKNKENCLSVNPVNKKDLSWSLLVLNHAHFFREKIARNGLKLAQNEFCWNKIAGKSLAFYKKLFTPD